jgi:DNA-binding IclR family transcriptional regulator
MKRIKRAAGGGTDEVARRDPAPATQRRTRRGAPGEERRLVQGIQSVELGGDILRALIDARDAVPLRDIASASGISKGKARRYLLSFTRIGLVEQDEATGYYRLGQLAIQLGLAALASLDVERLSLPILADLRRTAQETVVLAIWAESGPTVLKFEESRRPVTLNVRVGSVLPMTRSATGLIFGTFLDTDSVKTLVADELAIEKPGGRERSAAFEAMLDEVRLRRLSRVEGSLLPGVSALGAPVFDHRGMLAAAIMVVGHNGIMDTSWTGPVATALAAAAAELSERLGSSGRLGHAERAQQSATTSKKN